jgi:two-component system, NarL family, sensor kinase
MQAGNSQIITFLIAITILVLLLVGVIITMLYLHQNRRIAFHEQLANTHLEIQEETFQHLSREIHDNIGLSLTLAKLYLNTLDTTPTLKQSTQIASSIELISQAISDLSHISKSLNSEAIKTEGFISVLRMKLEKIQNTKKFEVRLKINGEPIFMESQSELIIYRITQEALNNIIKHSKATHIHVTLSYFENSLMVEIRDNGVGINWSSLEKTKSGQMPAGLNNMKKRAKMINGSCEIKSDHTGTTVVVTIPLQINERSITN